jgi:hypothetical protein
MAHDEGRSSSRRKFGDREMSLVEAERKYSDSWVLFEITEKDDFQRPARGIVRYASKNRRRITDESLRLRDTRDREGRPCHISVFYALPEPESEEEAIEEGLRVMELVAELARPRRTRAKQPR